MSNYAGISIGQRRALMYDLGTRYIGQREVPGDVGHNEQIMAMIKLDAEWAEGDETAWCSAFVGYMAFLAKLERPKSLRARSWLDVGSTTHKPQRGDVTVLWRKDPDGPFGHVGLFDRQDAQGYIHLLGGNQNDSVKIAKFPPRRLLSHRRLARAS